MLCLPFIVIILILIITLVLSGNPPKIVSVICGGVFLAATVALTLFWWKINYRHYSDDPGIEPD